MDEETLYTVEAARKFKLTKVVINFVADTAFDVEVIIKRGIRNIVPREGYISGDSGTIEVNAEEEISSGERIIVYWKNNNATTDKKFFVLIEGELM